MTEQKKDPAEGWTHEGGGVWVQPMPSERATSELQAHKARCSVATGSAAFCFRCGKAFPPLSDEISEELREHFEAVATCTDCLSGFLANAEISHDQNGGA